MALQLAVAGGPHSQPAPPPTLVHPSPHPAPTRLQTYKEYIRDTLIDARAAQPAGDEPIKYVVLDMTAVTDIDATFIHLFDDFTPELVKYYDAVLLMAAVQPQARAQASCCTCRLPGASRAPLPADEGASSRASLPAADANRPLPLATPARRC